MYVYVFVSTKDVSSRQCLAMTRLDLSKKNKATAVVKAKKLRQKTSNSRHLLIRNKVAELSCTNGLNHTNACVIVLAASIDAVSSVYVVMAYKHIITSRFTH